MNLVYDFFERHLASNYVYSIVAGYHTQRYKCKGQNLRAQDPGENMALVAVVKLTPLGNIAGDSDTGFD